MKKKHIIGLIKGIEIVLKSPESNLSFANKKVLTHQKKELKKNSTKLSTPEAILAVIQSLFIITEIIKEVPHIIELIKEISPHF